MPHPNLPTSPTKIKCLTVGWTTLLIMDDGGWWMKFEFVMVSNSNVIKMEAKSHVLLTHQIRASVHLIRNQN